MSRDTTWGNYSQRISAVAAAVSCFIAAGALWYVAHQIGQTRAINRESAARASFRQYLEFAAKNPDFSVPHREILIKENKLPEYRFFVSTLLFTCEEVLATFPDDVEWREACVSHMSRHVDLLHERILENSFGTYEDQMRCLINFVVAKKYPDVKECKQHGRLGHTHGSELVMSVLLTPDGKVA